MPTYSPLSGYTTVNEMVDRINQLAADITSIPAGAVAGPGGVTADRLAVFAGTSGYVIKQDDAVVSPFAYSYLSGTTANAVRSTIGAQQSSTALLALASPSYTANTIPYFDTASTCQAISITAFGRTILAAANNGAAITALGLSNSAQIASTSANTGSTIVQRDASGNFSAGTITASLNGPSTSCTGNAATSSVASTTPWAGVSGKPTTLGGYGISDALPISGGALTGPTQGTIVNLTDAATITANFALANNMQVTIAGNRTLGNPSNLVPGQSGSIIIFQDSVGSRTISYGSKWYSGSGALPLLSTAANGCNVIYYYVLSSTCIHYTVAKVY